MTTIAELRELGVADLEQRQHDLADQIFRLRLQKSMGQADAAGKLPQRRAGHGPGEDLAAGACAGRGDAGGGHERSIGWELKQSSRAWW